MKNPRVSLGLTFGVVLLSLALWIPRRGGGGGADVGPPRERSTAPARSLADSATGRSRPNAGGRTRELLAEHRVEDLARFVLPGPVEVRDLPLKEAVGVLMEAYKEACQASLSQPLKLQFVFPNDANQLIRFFISKGNFGGMLAHVAALAGYGIRMDGLTVGFEPVSEGGPRMEKSLPVPPRTLAELGRHLERLGTGHDGTPWGLLVAAGWVGDGGSVELGSDGNLHGKLTEAEFARLESWLGAQSAPVAHKVTAVLLHSEKPLGELPAVSAAGEMRGWLEAIATQPGVQVVTLPTALISEGNQGTIDLSRGTDTDWVGSRVLVQTQRTGLKIGVNDTTEHRADVGGTGTVRATHHTLAGNGESAVAAVSKRTGQHLYRVLTVEEMPDEIHQAVATGPGGGHPVGARVPGKEGFMFSPHNGKLIDVRGIPSGTLVADPTFPPSERKYIRVP